MNQQIIKVPQLPLPESEFYEIFSLPKIIANSMIITYSDDEAYYAIVDYLQQEKMSAREKFTLLDLKVNLGLPIEQINRILDRLQQEGRVVDDNDF